VRSKVAYHKDCEGMKYKRRQTYNLLRQNLLDRRSLLKLVEYAVTKNYKNLHEFLLDTFNIYVSKIIRTIMRGKSSAMT